MTRVHEARPYGAGLARGDRWHRWKGYVMRNAIVRALARPTRRTRLAAASLILLAVAGTASAQIFDADSYFQRCLRFEANGDLLTAREMCQNALQVEPGMVEARLALGRIEVGLGEYGSAENRLNQVRNQIESAEPLVLLAQIALETGRSIEAEALLANARSRLDATFNRELAARTSYLEGRIHETRGRVNEALLAYDQAIASDSLEVRYRLADAELRYRLGDLEGAMRQLQAYQELAGSDRNADVRSLMGRILWSMSELDAASGQLETALALRGIGETQAQMRDLRALALVYYGQGDIQSGGLALREASRRGNLVNSLLTNSLMWALVLLVLVAGHLIGESRIERQSSLEVIEGPQPWSVGEVYGVFFASLLAGLAIALVYSVVVFQNIMAIATPLQASDVRSVFFITFAVLSTLLSIRSVQRHGWDPGERLLGDSTQILNGALIGLVFLAAMLAYLAYRVEGTVFGPFFLDLSRTTPLVVVALILLPLSELFFRAYAYPALARRYDRQIATVATASLFALVLFTPVLVMFVFGLVLSEIFRRTRSGAVPVVTQIVFHLGLVVAIAISPWARSLFL